ncbi:PREDICTED: scavenger receptor cysteine-rich type 1 protein M130-like [Acropora digitifera]|uniref:scavenger receptor cysteine-rich type 1 protein M130-like n=1 Tax=Acropora digitifera TaxID=70779 RepID=UPI00077A70DA|nr:PREDICTED: scavenger receptor cysteine-rich type 1 protein M130-like [Acropora digitifera]
MQSLNTEWLHQWSHCTKNIGGIQLRIRRCVNPSSRRGRKLCPGPDVTVIRGCTNISRCPEEFRVSFRTRGYPSTGSMGIFSNGTWKDLCVANWDVVEGNLVCQAQGYNGSSLRVHAKSGTNSLGNTNYSCEQLTQNCEEKINMEINCSVPVRLAGVDGVNYAGRVEVFYQGKWGKICRMESEEPFGDEMPNFDICGTVFKELFEGIDELDVDAKTETAASSGCFGFRKINRGKSTENEQSKRKRSIVILEDDEMEELQSKQVAKNTAKGTESAVCRLEA